MQTILKTLETNGFDAKTYDKIPNFVLVKCNKKSVMEIRVKKNSVIFNCKEKDLPKKVVATKISEKYYMPVILDVAFEQWASILNGLLAQIDKNYRKEVA